MHPHHSTNKLFEIIYYFFLLFRTSWWKSGLLTGFKNNYNNYKDIRNLLSDGLGYFFSPILAFCLELLSRFSLFMPLTIIQIDAPRKEIQSSVELLATPSFLSPSSTGVCRGASVHALLCHEAADGEGTHRRHHRRSPLLPQRGQAHQAADWLQNTGQ